MDEATQYLLACKSNYFSKIYPSDNISKDSSGYKTLQLIAQSYFDAGKFIEFAGFLMEGHYFVNLWTAHLILENGNPDKKTSEECIAIIKEYSTSTLNTEVAFQEKNWLNNYLAS